MLDPSSHERHGQICLRRNQSLRLTRFAVVGIIYALF
jgi:hypothetical protein